MSKCWSEGELRACLDGELPEQEREAAARHLAECETCSALNRTVAERAGRVAALMQGLGVSDLPVKAPAVLAPRVVKLAPRIPLWARVAVPAALAAGVILGFIVHGKMARPAVQPKTVAIQPVSPPGSGTTEPQQATESLAPPSSPSPRRAAVRPPRRSASPVRTVSTNDYYLALDDEPIETGVVMRVALGSENVQADVIFDSQGRPRAIRSVR